MAKTFQIVSGNAANNIYVFLNMAQLDLDTWSLIFGWLPLKDAIRLSVLSKEFISEYFDESYAKIYARSILLDSMFWTYAKKRPVTTSKPLKSYREEIKRIELCRRCGGIRNVHDIYDFWKVVDM